MGRPRRKPSHVGPANAADDRGIDDDGCDFRGGAVVDAVDRRIVWLDDQQLTKLAARVGLDLRVETESGDVICAELRYDPSAGFHVWLAVPAHERCGAIKVRRRSPGCNTTREP